MTEHSPLPWISERKMIVSGDLCVATIPATDANQTDEDKANAAYIVTAANAFPELVDIVRRVFFECEDTFHNPDDDMAPAWKYILKDARAALKSAGVTDA